MHLGVSGNGNFEVRDFFQAGDEIGGVGITVRVRLVALRTLGRVAAQGDEVPYTHVPVFARDVVDLTAAGADAGQVRRRR